MRHGVTAGIIAALSSSSVVPGQGAPANVEDSVVLERTHCLGTCPAYRVSITAAGMVRFQSRNPGEDSVAGADSVAPAAFASLVADAERKGFFQLPERIDEGERELCGSYATDHPTVTVSIWRAAVSKRVVHYHGCGPGAAASEPLLRLRRLRSLEAAIDSVAGTRRWVRPAKPPWPRRAIR